MEARVDPTPMTLRKAAVAGVVANATDAMVNQMADATKAFASTATKDSGLEVRIKLVSSYPAQACHEDCNGAVTSAAAKLDCSNMLLVMSISARGGPGHAGLHDGATGTDEPIGRGLGASRQASFDRA